MTRAGRLAALAIGVCLACPPAPPLIPSADAREARSGGFGFRLPWETRKPERRTKRSKPAPRREARPPREAPGAKRNDRRAPAPAATARPAEALARLAAPLGLASFAGVTAEAEEWRSLAAQIPAPAGAPQISPDGPAPAPASVVALYSPAPPPAAPPRVEEPLAPAIPLPPRRGGAEEDASPDASASDIPLPPRRPGEQMTALPPPEDEPVEPEAPDIAFPALAYAEDPDCQALERENVVVSTPAPPIEGPGECGSPAPVSMTGVRLADGRMVEVKPAATLRCAMARTLATYVREDLAPAAAKDGETLAGLQVAGSFVCRGRNGAAGGKMSEHGRADAVDISSLQLAGDKAFAIFAKDMPQTLKAEAKSGACGKFNTVLGPGSDGHHEDHLHLDLQPRRSKTKLCQWGEPAEPAEAKEGGARQADDQPRKAREGLAPEKPLLEPEKPLRASARSERRGSLPRRERTP